MRGIRLGRSLAMVVATALMAVSSLIAGVVPALAAGPTPSTTQVEPPDYLAVPPGRQSTLTAQVTPWTSGDGGMIAFSYRLQGTIDETPIAAIAPTGCTTLAVGCASVVFPATPADRPVDGTYDIVARFSGSSTLTDSEGVGLLIVGPFPTITTIDLITPGGGATARVSDQVYVSPIVVSAMYPGGNPYPLGGTVAVSATNGVVTRALGNVPILGGGYVDTATLTAGSWTFTGVYQGNNDYAPSTSPGAALNLLANIVEATGVGVTPGTFYPHVDGYRDSLTIKGTRAEPISVAVKLYGPTGKLIKTWSVAAGAGPYSLSWTGRTGSGALYPSGTYKVIQTLSDGAGLKLVVTSKAVLSPKRLVWTSKTITKLGKAFTSHARAGSGKITTSGVPYAGGVRICCGRATAPPEYFAAAGWTFTLPSAVKYGTATVRVYGRDHSTDFGVLIALQDWTLCTSATTFRTDLPGGCFLDQSSVGTTYKGYPLPVVYGTNVKSRTIRAIAKTWAATGDIAKVTLTVRIAVLR